MTSFEGMMAPVFTPFKPDWSLNGDVIPKYAAFLQKHGVKGVYVCGTGGEGMSLTLEERKQVAEWWVEAAEICHLKVMVMVGAGCLKSTQILASHAESLGVYGIATLPCLYDKPANVDELIDYCREVALAAPKTPLYYYHIPFKTDVTFPMDEFLSRGSEVINTLAGLKFTSDDVAEEGLRCLKLNGGKFHILSGFDQKISEALKLGFTSAINCSFNFIPDEAGKIFDAAKNRGEEEELWWNCAQNQQKKVNRILDTIFSITNGFSVTSIKAAMTLLTDIDVGPSRKPLRTLSSDEISNMKSKLDLVIKDMK